MIDLLDHKDCNVWDRAIHRLIQALEMEESQYSNCDDDEARSTHDRLKGILEAITVQALDKPEIFEAFYSSFQFLSKKSPYNHLILEWLDELNTIENRQAPIQEAILAAKIFLGAYDSTWQAVGATLLELLDHTDRYVRACVAYQIGKFCSKAICSRANV